MKLFKITLAQSRSSSVRRPSVSAFVVMAATEADAVSTLRDEWPRMFITHDKINVLQLERSTYPAQLLMGVH